MRLGSYLAIAAICGLLVGCSGNPVKSAGGVDMATVHKLHTNPEGHTVEQQNIIDRITADNKPGSVKHLYVMSAYSGQVLLYSPVRGKVTSGGKKLTPTRIEGVEGGSTKPIIDIDGRKYGVSELPNEDGTFGSGSSDYLYWFTPDGRYHQHYLSGGQIVHVSDTPIAVKNVAITIESK